MNLSSICSGEYRGSLIGVTTSTFGLSAGIYNLSNLQESYPVIKTSQLSQGSFANCFTMGNFRFFGNGSSGSSFSVRMWNCKPVRDDSNINKRRLTFFSSFSCILGNLAGTTASSIVKTTETYAKEINTFVLSSSSSTPAGPASFMYSTIGVSSPTPYSPGGSEIAELFVPDLLNATEILVEIAMNGGGATSGNFTHEFLN